MSADPHSEDAKKPVRTLSKGQQERRQRILVSTYMLLAEHGYEALSMKAIAKAAGVAERTLFNIYETKDALIATSARQRSDAIMQEAWDLASDHRQGYLLSLCETLARRTLDAPEVARGLAPIVVQQADLVGLTGIYQRFLGKVLAGMAVSGEVDPGDVEAITVLIAMRMISAIKLWASGAIPDDDLEDHMRLSLCQVLIPHVKGELGEWALAEARAAMGQLQQAGLGERPS